MRRPNNSNERYKLVVPTQRIDRDQSYSGVYWISQWEDRLIALRRFFFAISDGERWIFRTNKMTTTTGVEFKTLLPVIAFSLFMFIVCMSIFGLAVQHEKNRLFAPRSWARPNAVSAILCPCAVKNNNAKVL